MGTNPKDRRILCQMKVGIGVLKQISQFIRRSLVDQCSLMLHILHIRVAWPELQPKF